MELNTLLSISAVIYIGYSMYNLFIFIYKMSHCISYPFKKLFNICNNFFVKTTVSQPSSQTFNEERITLTSSSNWGKNKSKSKDTLKSKDPHLLPFSQVN